MLLAALVCPGLTGCVPAHTQSTHLLRPGETIIGAGGVRVSAPAQWDDGPEAGVRVTITRLDRDTLNWPLESGTRLVQRSRSCHSQVCAVPYATQWN